MSVFPATADWIPDPDFVSGRVCRLVDAGRDGFADRRLFTPSLIAIENGMGLQ